LFGFFYSLLGKYEEIAKTGMLVGISLVIIGAVLLYIELGNKKRFYRVVVNPSSWVARGAWFITIFSVFAVIYLYSVYRDYSNIDSIAVKTTGLIAAVFAIFVMSYSGFLLAAAKRIPLWNVSGLPMLFFFSSLCTGNAVILVISASLDTPMTGAPRLMVFTQVIIIFLQMIALGTFLGTASYGGTTVSESVHLLIRDPLFVTLAIVLGLLIPLGLLAYQALMNSASILIVPAGILLLVGGHYLRHGILRAGIRLPVSIP